MKNVMIDLETLDIICSARIISIGAVEFDLESKQLGREFFMLVDHTSQIRRTTSEDTLKWWDGQSEAAKKQLTGYILLSEALMEFRDWLPEDCIVWGNGSSFDIGILEHAYTEFSMLYPWKYNAIRDVRTINHLYTLFQ